MLSRASRWRRPPSYATWIERSAPAPHEHVLPHNADRTGPLFSLIIAAPPGDDLAGLDETITSLLAQTYARWDACIVLPPGGAGWRNPVAWPGRDARIRVADGQETVSLAAAARGEFVAPLFPGDRLAAHALSEVGRLVSEAPQLDVVYTDEDRLGAGGARRDPFFKPAWSPELLLSVDYLSPPFIRRRVLLDIGDVSCPLDDMQRWNLVLRCTERTEQIGHIAQVLYHRSRPALSATPPAQPPAHPVEAHLRRQGLPRAATSEVAAGTWRTQWPHRNPRVSIIIPNRDQQPILERCLTSLLDHTSYRNFEIIIVDNGSTEPRTLRYYDRLRTGTRATVLPNPGLFNYSRANNRGARAAGGEMLLFLNNDIAGLNPDWLDELVRWAERPAVGVVGPKLMYPHNRVQHAGVVIGMAGLAEHVFRDAHTAEAGPFGSVNWYRNYMAVTGACLMMRRTVFQEAGGFDEGYRVAGGDIELCVRMVERGYRIVYTPFACLCHYEGATRGRLSPAEDVRRLRERLGALIDAGDPYFNPNLSTADRIPALRDRAEAAGRPAHAARVAEPPPRSDDDRAPTAADRRGSQRLSGGAAALRR